MPELSSEAFAVSALSLTYRAHRWHRWQANCAAIYAIYLPPMVAAKERVKGLSQVT
jgi:hypothetical protein